MPLIHSKSKKAFEKNVETEMRANPDPKDRAQNLAIAYSVKRKAAAKKKMAEGGLISAKTEKRPMPSERNNDSRNVSQNSADKPLKDSNWTGQPTTRQAQNPGLKGTKIKHPKMVKSDVLQVRLRDEEDDLQSSAVPASPAEQPSKSMDEEDATRRGKSPTKQTSIATGRQVMAEGGEANVELGVHPNSKKKGESTAGRMLREGNKEEALKEHRYVRGEQKYETPKRPLKGLAEGGKVTASDYDDTDPNASTDSFKDDTPSEDEGESMAMSHNEEHQTQTSGNPDDSEPHSDDIDTYKMAEGGPVHEEEIEHHDSITAAIMARRDRLHAAIDSGAADLDEAARMAAGGSVESGSEDMNMADGGEVDLEYNAKEQPNEFPPDNGEALDWDAHADYLDASQPEDSNETGDEREDARSDKKDMISAIRRKRNARQAFSDN